MIKPSVNMPEQFSVTGTIFWMFGLFLIPSLIIFILLGLPLALFGYNHSAITAFLARPETELMTVLLVLLITYPMLKAACYHSLEKGLPLNFLAIKPIALKPLSVCLIAALIIIGFESLVFKFFGTPEFESMVKLREVADNGLRITFVGITTCILTPILEELIFRGVIYTRLEKSRYGARGAVVITSITFTMIHIQYTSSAWLIMLPASFLLGYVRYKTANVNYCIAIHSLFNAFALMATFTVI